MDLFTFLIHRLHEFCFVLIVALAIYGGYCTLLLHKQLKRRRFASDDAANDFLDQLRVQFRNSDFEEAESLCTSPDNWYRALPLLAETAIKRRHQPTPKIKQAIAGRFSREVVTSMETMVAQMNTVVKCEPMCGLLGTVSGMIGAFTVIAKEKTPSPQQLMAELSVALYATAMSLSVAVVMLLIVSIYQVRLRKFEDSTIDQIGVVVEDLEVAAGRANRPAA